MDNSSERRLVENEVIFREANKDIQQFLQESNSGQRVVEFYCECSYPDCRGRIKLTPAEYQSLHQNKLQFLLLPKHDIPAVEKIISHHQDFNVVEKYGEVPGDDDIDAALRDIQL